MATEPAGATRHETPTRRSFLHKLWIALGIAALVQCVAVLVGFFRSRKPPAEDQPAQSEVICGPVEQFQPRSVTAFAAGRFYLARLEDGGFLALSARCTHLGCTVPWNAETQQFACPCHGSVFDLAGTVLHGPASRPLDLYPVRIENRVVKVAGEKAIRRSALRQQQITYPDKA